MKWTNAHRAPSVVHAVWPQRERIASFPELTFFLWESHIPRLMNAFPRGQVELLSTLLFNTGVPTNNPSWEDFFFLWEWSCSLSNFPNLYEPEALISPWEAEQLKHCAVPGLQRQRSAFAKSLVFDCQSAPFPGLALNSKSLIASCGNYDSPYELLGLTPFNRASRAQMLTL